VADADEFLREQVQEVPPEKFFDPQRHYRCSFLCAESRQRKLTLPSSNPNQPVIGNGERCV
jgi:hypothetical protein